MPDLLSFLAHDKCKHVVLGLLVYLLAAIGCQYLGLHAGFALIPVLIAAVGKEIADHFFGGTVDPWDAVATMAGAAPIILEIV